MKYYKKDYRGNLKTNLLMLIYENKMVKGG
jgi:hypothetical protein